MYLNNILHCIKEISLNLKCGSQYIQIEHITWLVENVQKNSLYFCIEEEEFPESYENKTSCDFINQAYEKGAVAYVVNKNTQLSFPSNTTIIETENVNVAMAWICKIFYNNPFENIKTIGITGTNGKTSTAYYIQSILNELNSNTATIGTLGFKYNDIHIPSRLTNPLAVQYYQYGKEMAKKGIKQLVVEATSHGIALKRNESIEFDIMVFTNFTQDHLDFHSTLDEYLNCKLEYFRNLGINKPAFAVINLDDKYANTFINALDKEKLLSKKIQLVTYAIDNSQADYHMMNIIHKLQGVSFEIKKEDSVNKFFVPLHGKFNCYNLLASMCVSNILGFTLQKYIPILFNMKTVPGRYEKIETPQKKRVFVDFAHTPGSLKNILQAIHLQSYTRLILVFGCGGDRDNSKRKIMGEIAEHFSDYCIITNDNPRTEEPSQIAKNILTGVKKTQSFEVILDRKQAIYKALTISKQDDIVLVAGKGHETYQIIGYKKIPFSDTQTIKKFFYDKNESMDRNL